MKKRAFRIIRGFAKGAALSVFLVLLIFLFLRTGAVLFAAMAAVLLFAEPVSLLWNRAAEKRMSVRVEIPSGVSKGKEAEGKVFLFYGRIPPAGPVECRIRMHNDLTGEQEENILVMERERNGFSLPFAFRTGHCGRIRVTADRFFLQSLCGICGVMSDKEAQGRVTVLPETFPVEIDDEMLAAPSMGEEVRDDRKGNDPSEMFEMRNYLPGDPVRGIHWKLSVKMDELIYREPAQSVTNELVLFWDQTAGSPAVLDTLAEAFFSVATSLTEQGISYTAARWENGEIASAEIGTQDALAEQLPLFLYRPAGKGSAEDAHFPGKVFYFTAEVPFIEDRESVSVFLCSENDDKAPEGVIAFTPANAEEILGKRILYDYNA